MRTFPSLQVKSVGDLKPGELVVADLGSHLIPAIFTHHFAVREDDPSPVLIYLAQPGERARGPFWEYAEGNFLSVGQEYVVLFDPLVLPPIPRQRNPVRTLILKNQRLLQVWDQNRNYTLALDLDSGQSFDPNKFIRPVECHAWEVRLKIDGAIDFRSPPIFQWNPAKLSSTE